jgi:hypothetical protein
VNSAEALPGMFEKEDRSGLGCCHDRWGKGGRHSCDAPLVVSRT